MPTHFMDGPPQRVGVREFRGGFTSFIRQVGQGASFLVTSHDRVVAEIRPPSNAILPPRKPGALKGKIVMAADFDDMPEDILAAMESDAG